MSCHKHSMKDEDIPSWKRALDELVTSEPPRKRPKHTESPAEGNVTNDHSSQHSESVIRLLGQLENGLNFIQDMDLSADLKRYAIQLRKLLFKEAAHLMSQAAKLHHPPLSVNHEARSNIHHTDVPPPVPAVQIRGYDDLPKATTALPGQWMLPPLPPISDLTLLSAPFTHSSALPHYMPATSTNTYEPLEFLGDAYLEVIATRLIHHKFPMHTVGQKANLREIVIKNETLAAYSKEYGLDKRIKYASGQTEHLLGSRWQKILADVFEAYVACIILSDHLNGFQIAEEWLDRLWEPKMKEWRESGEGKSTGIHEFLTLDAKSELQRFLVSKGVRIDYLEDKPMQLDKNHNRTTFHMAVYLTGWGYNRVRLGSGSGRSKQLAGAEAAKNAFACNRALLQDAHQKKLEFDRLNKALKKPPVNPIIA